MKSVHTKCRDSSLSIIAVIVGALFVLGLVKIGVDASYPYAWYRILTPVLALGFITSFLTRLTSLGFVIRVYVCWATGFMLASLPFRHLGWVRYEESTLVGAFGIAVIASVVIVCQWSAATVSLLLRLRRGRRNV